MLTPNVRIITPPTQFYEDEGKSIMLAACPGGPGMNFNYLNEVITPFPSLGIDWLRNGQVQQLPTRCATRQGDRRRWLVMPFEEALRSLASNSQVRLTEPQRSQREKQASANENEDFRAHESESGPSSGAAKTQRSGKGVWYPEEPDRDLWSG